MSTVTWHILPAAGRWEVTEEGLFDVLADFTTKAEAMEWASTEAPAADADVVVHKEDFSVE